MNNKLWIMWKLEVAAKFYAIFQHPLGGEKRNTREISADLCVEI
jgi:hypothetical protein